MPTSSYNKFQDFVEQFAKGIHDLDSQVFKVYLSNELPLATDTIKTDIAEISAGNGYSAGGATTTITVTESAGTATVQGTQVAWTAAGGSIGPFRYAVLYNDSATSPADALVAWFDYGSALTLADGESLTIKFNNASPGTIFTLA